jgi:hypothetical protein
MTAAARDGDEADALLKKDVGRRPKDVMSTGGGTPRRRGGRTATREKEGYRTGSELVTATVSGV